MTTEPGDIDWSTFDQYPEPECGCRCGAVFRSHAKALYGAGGIRTRKPCPKCGKSDTCIRISTDPEVVEL